MDPESRVLRSGEGPGGIRITPHVGGGNDGERAGGSEMVRQKGSSRRLAGCQGLESEQAVSG